MAGPWGLLLDLAFPEGAECPVCGRGSGRPACARCLAVFRAWWAAPGRCRVCGRPERGPSGLCRSCWAAPPPFNRARSVGVYMGAWRRAIVRFKFGGRRHLAGPLGELAVLAYRRSLFPAQGVAPVPASPRHLRRRGFNQAELIARVVAARTGLPLYADALVRRDAPPQAGRTRRERWTMLAGEITPGPGLAAVGSRSLLLVDDILTTGATASACAALLRAAGCRRVEVLVLAVGVPAC